MHYVVLAYPKITKEDYDWIQEVRSVHDKQYSIVDPHFTIVFPTEKLSEAEFLAHVHSIKLQRKSYEFSLSKAVVKENIYPKYYQVHLVADHPIVGIIELHDKLYVGSLAGELRTDIEYLPHITIASNKDEKPMQELASQINAKNLHIHGSIDSVVVSSFDGSKVVDIERIFIAG